MYLAEVQARLLSSGIQFPPLRNPVIMQIELHLPRSFDASVEYDPALNVIHITPNINRGVVPLIGVLARSADKSKQPKRSMINFDMGSGEPTLQTKRQQNAGTSFDDPGPAADSEEAS